MEERRTGKDRRSMADDDYWRGQVDAKLDMVLEQLSRVGEASRRDIAAIKEHQMTSDKRIDKLESKWDRSLGIALGIAIGGGAAGGGMGALLSSLVSA